MSVSERPDLDNNLDGKTFKEYYYLYAGFINLD